METLLGMCIQGSIMIVAVLSVRAIAGRWIPPLARKVVWGFVLARLLVPFAVIPPWLDRVEINLATGGSVDFASVSATAQAGILGPVFDGPGVLGGAADVVGAARVFEAIWFAGALVMIFGFVALYVLGTARLAHSLPTQDEQLLGWAADTGLRRTLRVRESAKLSAPLTYGLVRPVIVVPRGFADSMPWHKIEMALRHELAHIKAFDVLFKAFLGCAVCLYWYNPLVWAMYIYANRDFELYCDERALGGAFV